LYYDDDILLFKRVNETFYFLMVKKEKSLRKKTTEKHLEKKVTKAN